MNIFSSSESSSSSSVSTEASNPNWEKEALHSLLNSYLSDKKAERYWKWIRRGFFIAFVLFIIILIVKETHSKPVSPIKAHTAMVTIEGEIAYDSPASASQIMQALSDAFDDKNAKAVVLLINSPGGSPVQAGIIHDEIKRLRQLHNKPVYAVVEDVCASAAYYVAAAADQIYVNKASLVGSIGVIMDGFGFTGTMKKLGVERRLVTAGKNKGFLDPFSPEKADERAHAQSLVNRIHQQFQQVVIEGRGDRLKNRKDLFTGLVWTGQEAVEKGLADDLKSLDDVAREVIGAKEIVDYTLRDNVAERIAKKFGASFGEAIVKSLSYQHVQ